MVGRQRHQPAIIGRVLNHKTQDATKVYARLVAAPVRNAKEEATAAMRKTGELGTRGTRLIELCIT